MSATIAFRVRQVRRGLWTYDLYWTDGSLPEMWSVGECHSRRDAEKSARAAVRAELQAEAEG